MSENKKVFFIVNKYSGSGYTPAHERRLLAACKSAGIIPEIAITQRRGHATELATTAVQNGFERIFAIGGDGTVNEAAQGVIGKPAALGVIPNGSGNGLARHLGISPHFNTALSLLRSGNVISMDTARINHIIAVNVAGIGFDGHVAMLFGRNGKRGLTGYVSLVLKEFWNYTEFKGRAVTDGDTFEFKTFIAAVANASQFGNNAAIAPHASVCDGQLDLCLIKKPSFIAAIGLVRKLFSGRIDASSLVTIRKTRKLKITLDDHIAFHVDGEAYPMTNEFDIEVVPNSLNVIVPENNRRL